MAAAWVWHLGTGEWFRSHRPATCAALGLQGAEAATPSRSRHCGVGLAAAVLLSWFFLGPCAGGARWCLRPSSSRARARPSPFSWRSWADSPGGTRRHLTIDREGALGLMICRVGRRNAGSRSRGPATWRSVPDWVGDLIDAKAAVGFTVDTLPALLGGLVWAATGPAAIASWRPCRPPCRAAGKRSTASYVRRCPPSSPWRWSAVAAGLAAAGRVHAGDRRRPPPRIAGAALLGAPNGCPGWVFRSACSSRSTAARPRRCSVELFLPDPLDRLLSLLAGRPVGSLDRLAGLDSRVWLLGVAGGLADAARGHPRGGHGRRWHAVWAEFLLMLSTGGVPPPAVRDPGCLVLRRAAARSGLGAGDRGGVPLLAGWRRCSMDASIFWCLGFDAFGAGIELHGQLIAALLPGALWARAREPVALLAYASGAARVAGGACALGDRVGRAAGTGGAEAAVGAGGCRGGRLGSAVRRSPEQAGGPGAHPGPYAPLAYSAANRDTNPLPTTPRGACGTRGRAPAETWRPTGPGQGARAGGGAGPPPGSGLGPDSGRPYEGGGARSLRGRGRPSPDRSRAPERAGSDGGTVREGIGGRARTAARVLALVQGKAAVRVRKRLRPPRHVGLPTHGQAHLRPHDGPDGAAAALGIHAGEADSSATAATAAYRHRRLPHRRRPARPRGGADLLVR